MIPAMFEQKSDPILQRPDWHRRIATSAIVAGAIIAASLGLGTAGYHVFAGLDWLDAMLNAAMILTGMGPVDRVETVSGKVFATFNALFSGIAFLGMAGVLIAPWAHRLLHHFHAELDEEP